MRGQDFDEGLKNDKLLVFVYSLEKSSKMRPSEKKTKGVLKVLTDSWSERYLTIKTLWVLHLI